MSFLRLSVLMLCLLPAIAFADIEAQSGPYRVSLTTQPRVIPIGKARVVLKITDQSGKALEGLDVRAIARMPGMFMGEREQRAAPVPSEPGTYAMQAAFPMAGDYEVEAKISGEPGAATVVLKTATGQDTGVEEAAGFSILSLIPWFVGLALIIFVIVRMRQTDQGVNWKGIFNRATITGVLLLAVMLAISMYAVRNWRRPGSMTPIEAQVMEMNTPAPPGLTAVELSEVKRGAIAETVRYTGQAVGFVEQDVNPRVTGVIISMPVYVGDRVKKGQVLARLDTSQLDPQLAERAAMSNMAAQGVGVASAEYQAALQEVAEARADISVMEGGVAEAEAMLDAARQEKNAMEAEVAAMQSDIANAQAEVSAAEEEAKFRNDELGRMKRLFEQKAVSRSEFQQAESEAAAALAKLRQAQAMVRNAESRVAAARANVRKADAMISAAQKRVLQAQAEVRAARAAVVSKQKAADAAKRNISKEQAAVAQARAGYQSAAAQRGYAALTAQVDGVITQRVISPGTLVNPGQTVLKVAQISPIRLQANVAAADLERIEVGATVTIAPREGGVPIETRVSSIQPGVDPQARTGVVEALWKNAEARFLPGQFVEMRIEVGAERNALTVPVEAIQRPPGEAEPFVWVAEPGPDKGRFTVKRVEVRLGASDGRRIAVSGEIKEGQQVVTQGGAYLREGGEVSAPVAEVAAKGPVVEVTGSGYTPDSVSARAGEPLTITFIRRTEATCGTEIVFPDLKITRPLPLNEPVEVTFTPEKSGEIRFTCGMDMFRGKVVVK
jgi:RND family efflux transporter MFP subunit